MAIVSKAQFEKELGKAGREGHVHPTELYRSQHASLRPLSEGGALFLVTVRPPDEKLWLVAVLESPTSGDEGWSAAKNVVPITDVSSLKSRLKFSSGTGITAKPGALGMSLQTPRVLREEDVALLRGASSPPSRTPPREVPSEPTAPKPRRAKTDAMVDDERLATLRAFAEARRDLFDDDTLERYESAKTRVEALRAVSVVCTKPSEAAEMYGESIDLQRAPNALTPAAQQRFVQDLANLDPLALVRAYPRDKNGFILGETVLLSPYDASEPDKRKRPWLVARGPMKRSHPQVIALLFDVIDEGLFPLQWHGQRHLWDRTATGASELERWGVADLPLPLLDAEERDARIKQLARSKLDAERAARSLLLLDAGRIEEAFAVYDVQFSREAQASLGGDPSAAIYEAYAEGHGTGQEEHLRRSADQEGARYGRRWREALRAELYRAAPWKLPKVELKTGGRRNPVARARLFNLPYPSAARRPTVFLEQSEQGRRIHIDFSGAPGYLAEHAWTRPIELDLLRFGLS